MSNINPFQKEYESASLDQWIRTHSTEEEMRELFLNMDRALKYIHDHDYCIQIFHPSEIEVLENSPDYINFKKLMELPNDVAKRKEMIKEDIFNSTLIQLSFYGAINSEKIIYFEPAFVKEHFDDLTQFLPSGDVPYYRGVIQRGASVYFCEFALERRKRELIDLEKQLGEENNDSVSEIPEVDDSVITNDRVNDYIYRRINGLKDSAFVNILVVPTIALVIIFIYSVIAWVISTFN